ncbi:Polysaccharide deacetylase [Moelleriella libera RCEF 2490]|uniref:chitin deacetylase n=1 Tax=Moelleriella libera RCEF 2490 TaxID=1081109 RepID=A0A166P6R3_9HYPO|nr:Polysaccharide deacetylase [Moelleriella libera RCEF 2490]
MPRLTLFRLPNKLRRQVRRSRMATLTLLALLLAVAVLFPLYSVYCVYKPPRALIGYLRQKYPDVLFEVSSSLLPPAAAPKIVALSLDDAPSSHTADILDVLREHDARATFFVIGSQADTTARAALLRRIVRDGHELANHGMRDEPRDLLVEAYRAEEQGGAAGAGVLPNNYYRPGSGFFNRAMRQRLGNAGYRITLGSVYPHDAQIANPTRNAAHILSMVHPGAIIICHDRRQWTAPMLRLVLPALRDQGYQVVTITDLVKTAEPLGGGRS